MRKHLLFLAILFVAFLSIGISGSVFAICTDSDANSTHSDGKNYSQKGELVYNGSTYVDYCYNLNPKYVLEWYCDSNGAKQYTWMLCDSGCVDGACKSSTGLSVNCGKLSDQITNDINYYGVVSCGNTNYKSANDVNGDKSVTAADILVAKSMTDAQCQTQLNSPKDVCAPPSITVTSPSTNCTDSDADSTHSDGKNYAQKGYVTYNGTKYDDYCYDKNPKYVLEWYCDSNGAKQYTWMLCADTCSDGACVSLTGSSINCGKLLSQITNDINYYGVVSCGNANYKSANDVNGDKSVTASDILVAKSMTDTQCQTQLNSPKDVCNPACTQSWQPTAWSTCSNGKQARSYTDSSNCGVATGKPADETQICLTTESCKLKTRDGRAGVTYTDRNGNARDYYSVCYGGRYLLEYSCNTNNRYYSQFKYCAKGCSAGMCLGSSTSMSEPNDDLTQDSNKLAIEFLTDQVASIANAIANLISQIKK